MSVLKEAHRDYRVMLSLAVCVRIIVQKPLKYTSSTSRVEVPLTNERERERKF